MRPLTEKIMLSFEHQLEASSRSLGVSPGYLQFKLYLASHGLPRGKVNNKPMRGVTAAAIQADVFCPEAEKNCQTFS